ncbi:transcriptional regulator [Enterobacter hormaechei]
MIFIISNLVTFNTLDGTLTLTGEQRQVKLPLTACRLLETLLSEPGKIYDREFLLTEVWDKQGLTGSNGNLNQYISILRRHFSTLGADDLIQTVPRIGFMINKDVEVKVFEVPYDAQVRADSQPAAPPGKKSLYLFFLSFVTFFSVLFCFYVLMFKTTSSEVDIVKSTFKGCNINYLSPFSNYEVKKLNEVVVRMLSLHGIQCENNNIVFFDYYKSANSTEFGRALLSVCQKGQTDSVQRCNSFYYYNFKA